MKRALDRLSKNPRAVQAFARAIEFTELLAETVERREQTVRRAAALIRCDHDQTGLTICINGQICRACRAELLTEFGL